MFMRSYIYEYYKETELMDRERLSYKEFYDKLDVMHRDITEIKIQTTKTNGRVTACEVRHLDHDKAINNLIKENKQQDQKLVKFGIVIAIIVTVIYFTTGYVIPFL